MEDKDKELLFAGTLQTILPIDFDEATSSLNKSLNKNIKNIFSNYKEKSIITPTHNQNVLESCKEVYDLDKL